MPRTSAKTEPPKPAAPSSTSSLIGQVEKVKETLKTVIQDLSTVISSVKLAEKKKRGTEKEVETIRKQLRRIQNVTI